MSAACGCCANWLRIGTFPSAGRAMIPAALTALARQHPGLEPMVSEIDPAGVADAIRAGELEVALIHEYDFGASRPEPGLATEALCTEAMYLVSLADPAAWPDFPSPGAGPADAMAIGRCRDAPWITATPGTMCQQMTVRACQAAGFTPRTRHQVDDFTTTLALVAAGQGVALVPQLGLADPPPGIVLTQVPLGRRTNVAYRSGAGRHPAVTAIIAALRSAVPPELGTAR
jgi:DNA-binding transcriptional LysR family regulator